MRPLLVGVALGAMIAVMPACERDPAEEAGMTMARGMDRAPGGGVMRIVRVTGEAGRLGFDPDSLELRPGDGVRFVQTQRVPVAIGLEGEAVVRTYLDDAGIRRGPLLVDPGDHLEVSFEDAPPGRYVYLGLGFEDRGMRGVLRVIEE